MFTDPVDRYLIDMWNNNWSKKTSYEDWMTEVINYTEQQKNFFYTDMTVDKYAGSVFKTNIENPGLNLEWHGHEISRSDLMLTTSKT